MLGGGRWLLSGHCRLDVGVLGLMFICFYGHQLIDCYQSWVGNSGVLLFPQHDAQPVANKHHK